MRRRRPLLAIASALVLVTSGCVAYRPVAPLGDAGKTELLSLAPWVAAERVRVVAVSDSAIDAASRLTSALQTLGAVPDDRAPTITVEVQVPWDSLNEPLIGVLTLGLFPEPGRGLRQYHWRLIADDGRQVAGDASVESPSWVGWLVAPVALLPGWRLTSTWDKETQEREEHSDARRARLALGLARSVVRLRSPDSCASQPELPCEK